MSGSCSACEGKRAFRRTVLAPIIWLPKGTSHQLMWHACMTGLHPCCPEVELLAEASPFLIPHSMVSSFLCSAHLNQDAVMAPRPWLCTPAAALPACLRCTQAHPAQSWSR